jgi:hypothetical protein
MKFPRLSSLTVVLCFVTALAFPADEALVGVRSTPLFREQDGRLEQMLRVHVPSTVAPGAKLTLEGPGYKISRELSTLEKIPFGGIALNRQYNLQMVEPQEDFLLPVPEIQQPTRVKVRFQNGRQTSRGEFALQPQRKWEIYIIHSTHTDVGYTDIAERVRRQLAAELRWALAACRQTEGFPEDAKFRWTVEAFLPLEDFWKGASAAEREEFLRYARQGRFEVTAAYMPHLSDIAGHESLLRFFYAAHRFAREHQLPLRSAMFSDSTGYAWVIPQVLNSLGIRYLSTAVNPTRALNPFVELPRAIHWESPDGSRVLVWNSDPEMAYPEGYHLRLAHSYEAALPLVLAYLQRLEASGFRFSEVGLRVAMDNVGPQVKISETIRDWNARWKFPHLQFSTNSEFLRVLEERHGKEIPAQRAAWPDWWSDYYISDARATGVHRLGHEWLTAAEKLSALARLARKDGALDLESLSIARQHVLMADEPVWGYAFAVDRPADWRTHGSNAEKVFDIHTGAVNARAVAAQAALALFGERLDWKTVVVFNPLVWSRDGFAKVELPRNYANLSGLAEIRGVRDRESGREFPARVIESDSAGPVVEFLAEGLPSLGYRVFDLLDRPPAQAASAAVKVGPGTFENEFYRIRVNETKGILSILDKELNRELVDPSRFGFNQYIYERPPGGDFKQVWGGMPWLESLSSSAWQKHPNFERFTAAKLKVRTGEQGPLAYSLVLEGSTEQAPLVRQEIILYPGVKRVDLVNTLRKQEIVAAEAAYFAFPFAVKNPEVRFEGANTIITPDRGQLPRSARDWYAVQHWVKLSGDDLDIIWTPLEAPLVQFGDLNTNRWLTRLPLENGTLFSFVMCNYWMTNTRPSQGGEMTFRYSFTSEKRAADDVSATHFGWNQIAPLIVAGPAGHELPWLAPPPAPKAAAAGASVGSYCTLDQPNVLLVSFKSAEGGEGYVLRLLEFAGKSTTVNVRFGMAKPTAAAILDASELEPPRGAAEAARMTPEGVTASLRPYELKTLRVNFP